MLNVRGTVIKRERQPITYNKNGQRVTAYKVTYTIQSEQDAGQYILVTDFDPDKTQTLPKDELIAVPIEVSVFEVKGKSTYELRVARKANNVEEF